MIVTSEIVLQPRKPRAVHIVAPRRCPKHAAVYFGRGCPFCTHPADCGCAGCSYGREEFP